MSNQMKTYTNKSGADYTIKKRYLVRYLSEDGLLKCFESYYNELGKYSFDSEEEALDLIGKEELHNALIIAQCNIVYQ